MTMWNDEQVESMALRALRVADEGVAFADFATAMAPILGRRPPAEVLDQLLRRGLVEIDSSSSRFRLTVFGRVLVDGHAHSLTESGDDFSDMDLPAVRDPGAPAAAKEGCRLSDEQQDRVIGAPVDARVVVEAGPGFGKTDVACARVARLVEDEGVQPASILLLSFTRTAVKEMRARIRALAAHGVDIDGVEIRTLDSFAWRLRTAMEESEGDVVNSYEDSIRLLASRLEEPGVEVLDLLGGYEHVFIDEAQDLHGPRVDLVAGLLRALPEDCGWTLFLDPAQAIYGWSEDDETSAARDHVTLLDCLDDHEQVRLETLFRTRDPALRRLLLGGRRLVLDESIKDRAERLRSVLTARAVEPTRKAVGYTIKDLRTALEDDESEDSFVLFRTRAQALDASSWLCGERVTQHRLRFGGLPTTVSPWVAVVVAGAAARAGGSFRVREAHLRAAFDAIENEWLIAGWTSAAAFHALLRIGSAGPGGMIDLRRVADAIASRRYPDDLFHREVGTKGPIIGTIHGAKGREARRVIMTVPPPREDSSPEAELGEARVLYVALSRAKEELRVREISRGRWRRLDNGRVWKREKKNAWKVEVGREGDVDAASSLAGLSELQVAAHQHLLASFDGTICNVRLRQECERDWRWQVHQVDDLDLGEAPWLAELSRAFGNEVWDVLKAGRWKSDSKRLRPGSEMRHVRWFDLTTTAVPRDHHLLIDIPEPWRTLRCWLSPVLSGLGRFYSRGF